MENISENIEKRKINKVLVIALILTLVVLGVLLFNMFNRYSSRFKKELESLNGTKIKDNTVRTVSIPMDNPIVYKSDKEVLDMINNNESFIVYFGFPSCPWCRSVIETFFKVAKDLNIRKVYYVDIENIRDKYVLDENNNLKLEKEGTLAYMELISKLSNVLSDYTLKDKEASTVYVGEKRIYAPNIIKIQNGVGVSITTGISEKQKNAYQEITEEMKQEIYNKIYEVLK